MKYVFLAVALSMFAFAEDAAPIKPEIMSETETLKVQNVTLREQLLQKEKDVLITQICTAHGIDIKVCNINPANGEVTAVKAFSPSLPKPTN